MHLLKCTCTLNYCMINILFKLMVVEPPLVMKKGVLDFFNDIHCILVSHVIFEVCCSLFRRKPRLSLKRLKQK